MPWHTGTPQYARKCYWERMLMADLMMNDCQEKFTGTKKWGGPRKLDKN